MTVKRPLYLLAGGLAVLLGVIGAFLPLLPTTPFLILAAWCFGRANPAWEARLLAHPTYGPQIRAWRERGAVPRRAKRLASALLLVSAAGGLWLLPAPWRYLPAGIGLLVGGWLWTRPD